MMVKGWTNQRRVAHGMGLILHLADGLSSIETPSIEPYILGFVHATPSGCHGDGRWAAPDGIRTVVVEYPRAAVALSRRARVEWTVDTERHVALSTAAHDGAGQEVATTELGPPSRQTAPCAALRSDTVIRAGEAQAKLGNKEREDRPRTREREVRMATHWQVLPKGMHVPWAKAFEEPGRLLLEAGLHGVRGGPGYPRHLVRDRGPDDATTGGKEG